MTLNEVYQTGKGECVTASDLDRLRIRLPGVLIVGEALVWVQVLHRDRPHGNVPLSSSETDMLFRWLRTKESRRLVSRRYAHNIRTGS